MYNFSNIINLLKFGQKTQLSNNILARGCLQTPIFYLE